LWRVALSIRLVTMRSSSTGSPLTSADPVPAARALMALGDGLMLHRLTVDPELDVHAPIERTVRAFARA
jgi:hypothetical protein